MATTTSREGRSAANQVTCEILDGWATDPAGPVALHLKQTLVPVEAVDGDECIIYPPTYADIGYNIDTFLDGTSVALIDSVGSQANRMEPIFKASTGGQPKNPFADLVPQIEIVLNSEKEGSGKKGNDSFKEKRSLLELAHRSADAVVRSSPSLSDSVSEAFQALKQTGDAGPLCALAPTSLVFGVWDSRGTGEKRPRLVRAIIRAWDVQVLHAAAQFNSVWKALDESQQTELEKEAKKQKKKLSEKGLKDAPAVFRKTKIPNYDRNDMPNPGARVLGGVLVRGRIEREVTVNLVALRGLRGKDSDETKHIQKYLLGLSLISATAEISLFLREGCHLRYTNEDVWHSIPRRGTPTSVELRSEAAQSLIQSHAATSANHFRSRWPKQLEHQFDLRVYPKRNALKQGLFRLWHRAFHWGFAEIQRGFAWLQSASRCRQTLNSREKLLGQTLKAAKELLAKKDEEATSEE